MLEEKFKFLKKIKGDLLDEYLAMGWYRQGFIIFTSHFVPLLGPGKYFRVHWLRYIVPSVQPTNKRATRAHEQFTITCKPFELTDEINDLHKLYAGSIVKFQANNELTTILVDIHNDIYDSYTIEIRDNGKLIAAGIFDKGKDSIAGIINFYDPAYKKYSPGKWLMVEKYKYCAANNISYYYPGYYTTEHTIFDYKLSLDKNATEVYLPETMEWVSYRQFEQEHTSEKIVPHT